MNQALLVVAKSKTSLNKFPQTSLPGALNIKDFLEQTGEYEDVSIFQLHSINGPMKEWVKLVDPDR